MSARAATLGALLAAFVLLGAPRARAEEPAPLLELGLGLSGKLEELVLPGPELVVREQDRDAPLIARILSVSPHGTARRYTIEVYGLEPGRYDLGELLARPDGSAPEGLPPLPIAIVDPLPPGRVEPNPLQPAALPWVGGYRLWLAAGLFVWLGGLVAASVVARRRARSAARAAEDERAPSLAARLRPLVSEARAGRLDPAGQARLERLLIAAWRRRLDLGDARPAAALAALRAEPEAGALLRALEAWLHQPPGRADPVDLDALLAPYERLDDAAWGPEPGEEGAA